MNINRRDFIERMGAAAFAAGMCPSVILGSIRRDERPLNEALEFTVYAIDEYAYRIPVRFVGDIYEVLESRETAIDRPIFGLPPKSFVMKAFQWNRELGGWGELELDPEKIGKAHVEFYRIRDVRTGEFITQESPVFGIHPAEKIEFVPYLAKLTPNALGGYSVSPPRP